jgi:phage-related protein
VTESTIGVIISLVQTGLTLIKDVINIATALIKGDWSGAWDGMKTLFSDFVTGVLDIFTAWFSPFYELWSQLW